MILVGVLVSGRGSNLSALIDAARAPECPYKITCVISDQPTAFALEIAQKSGIPAFCYEKSPVMKKSEYEQKIVARLKEFNVQVIALAGFMRILGKTFLAEYAGRVLNIHPSLLPAFPGLHAQEQAFRAQVCYAGCTVHLVDAGMDTGPILDQACLRVDRCWDEQTLALRILELEHRLYPVTLARFCQNEFRLKDGKIHELSIPAWLQPIWRRFTGSHFGMVTPVLAKQPGVLRVAISACLCGFPCRYDGHDKRHDPWMAHLHNCEILPVCPEVLAGMGIPRLRIQYENENPDTIPFQPLIKNEIGIDVTETMKEAVACIVQWCKENQIQKVILKESSPSCGVRQIPWKNTKIKGSGILTSALQKEGFEVISSERDPF